MERGGDGESDTVSRETREETVGFRPLYRQVYDTFLRRLADGVWNPGHALPSEAQLALEIGVSQGTVRKALDALTAESLLIRRQGRGTFVAEHGDPRSVFRFFKLRPDRVGEGIPGSRVTAIDEVAANVDERERLALVRTARVVRIQRLRLVDERLCVSETIAVPSALFPGLTALEIPNTLYRLYAAKFGIIVAGAKETIKAVGIPKKEAILLDIPEGTPVLEIDRVAHDLDERPVEWRLSLCLTQDLHYLSELR